MLISLEYTLDSEAYLAQFRSAGKVGLRNYRRNHLRWGLYALTLSTLGLLASVEAKNTVLSTYFAIVSIAQALHAASYVRHYQKYLKALSTAAPKKHVVLLFDESGLRETVEGIESFAPWSCVKSYKVFERVLLLELTAAMASIIPLSAFEQRVGTTSAEFLEFLRVKSIPVR